MNQNIFCSKCHRIPSQCCCNTAPRELSDDEIDECLYATDWSYDPHSFARAILKKASEK
jgi:hypothetical protein